VYCRVNGQYINEQAYGPLPKPQLLPFPMELPFLGLKGGDFITIEIDARGPYDVMPYMMRYVSTQVDNSRTTLLRVLLDELCEYGPACGNFNQTCVYGSCTDPYIPPSELEDYAPDWATYSFCKGKNPGPPTFALGTGASAYAPLNDMDTVNLNEGGQGGHHLWIGARMKNFSQFSSLLITGHVPGLNLDVGPFSYTQTFYDEPHSDSCDTWGITFWVDSDYDYSLFLGQQMQITATLEDGDGQVAMDTKLVNIAPTLAP
jgi:hypothetical protein